MPFPPILSAQNMPKYKFFLSYNTRTDVWYTQAPPCRGSRLKKSVIRGVLINNGVNDDATAGGGNACGDWAMFTPMTMKNAVSVNKQYLYIVCTGINLYRDIAFGERSCTFV